MALKRVNKELQDISKCLSWMMGKGLVDRSVDRGRGWVGEMMID